MTCPPKSGFKGWLLPIALVMVLAFAGLGLSSCQWHAPVSLLPGPDTQNPEKQWLELYHEAWNMVQTDYVDPSYNGQSWYRWKDRYDKQIHSREDAYEAIRTMLASLNDNYTRFLDPRSASDQNMHIDSRLFGVGVQIAVKDNQIVVIAPLDDSPAKKAGILPMDRIVQVNGQPTGNMAVDDVVDKIRGPKGTPVTLTILRKGHHHDVKLVRAEIVIKTVFGEPISKSIGYIRLTSFISQDTSDEMRRKLLAQKNTQALIVDIRGNSGGLLPNALDISNMFLNSGQVIVSISDRDGNRQSFTAKSQPIYTRPVVLLVDEGSASASEIFSGALQDHHRATLIGSRTFGKGLVQKINYLQDGSEVNLTISKYYTPSGRDINKKGIEPNINVPITLSDVQHNKDPQKDAAINFLKTHFLVKAS